MFDLNKLGDMAKIAGEARAMQEKQERTQREQTELLKNIANKLDQVITLLKQDR